MFSLIEARRRDLQLRYAEAHRFYHGQAHIEAMLRGLQALGTAVHHPAAVELAIWYHDAIYDPASRDNEARSAALLRAELTGCAAPALIGIAASMIEATADHVLPEELPEAVRADCAAFLDLDLAVLGTPWDEYARYEQGIAAEYVPVHGEAAYRAGRAAFLRGMLARQQLFHTDRCNAALDAPARSNLRRALQDLG